MVVRFVSLVEVRLFGCCKNRTVELFVNRVVSEVFYDDGSLLLFDKLGSFCDEVLRVDSELIEDRKIETLEDFSGCSSGELSACLLYTSPSPRDRG